MGTPRPRIEACILAGGLSARMGRDKSRLRLGGRVLSGHAKALAAAAGFPVRIVREDSVARCGPLGGIHTALQSSGADAVLFLACDMPFVPLSLVRKLMRALHDDGESSQAAFCTDAVGRIGFPFLLRHGAGGTVADSLRSGSFSLQSLAKRLGSRTVALSPRESWRRMNLNTPDELARARARLNELRRRLGEEWPPHAPLVSVRGRVTIRP